MMNKSLISSSPTTAERPFYPQVPLSSTDFAAMGRSDVALATIPRAGSVQTVLLVWINGTSLSINAVDAQYEPAPAPTSMSQLPFPRFAWTASTSGSALFLYHQVDLNTIVEMTWNKSSKAWASSNISVNAL